MIEKSAGLAMHIPDGYLSPSTCATLYVASAPFWYVALRRVKAALSGQTVPLLAVFAAFSFVVMMFNLPLPGGTTGHAVGMAIGAIVLGPAVSIMAVSMALLIQALFFGDGGITAYGANCFNMAIVGSVVAYVVYRVVAGQAALRSKRRVVAAAIAGYTAINAAAFCAAVEFGVQPVLVSRCGRRTALCAISFACGDSSDDDRAFDDRGFGGIGDHGGLGELFAAH